MSEYFDLRKIMLDAGGYSPEAYVFLRDGLEHTVKMIHGESALSPDFDDEDSSRHVTGQQLCLGLRDFAVERYGMLAKTVLSRWGVSRTDDFGAIVFALVDAGLMRKTERDRIEDFQSVYDFEEAFNAAVGPSIGAAD
ncbi:MAG: hypothetical protein CMJ31_13480 [Phycisphaerae bacterium]|nr:hypothetical protein [Phycisphaerae bacterium]